MFSPTCSCRDRPGAHLVRPARARPGLGGDDRRRRRDGAQTRPTPRGAAGTPEPDLERTRRRGAGRAGGALPTGGPARSGAAHDRAAEPDPCRHDAAGASSSSAPVRGCSPPTATVARTGCRFVTARTARPASSLYVDGDAGACRSVGSRSRARIDWNGRVDGEPLPPGVYALDVRAEDQAGNASEPSRRADVVIRYVALGRDRIETRPGARFSVLVAERCGTRGVATRRRSGTARPGTLRLRAPLQPGRFTLVVSANGFEARAAVLVRRTPAP